MNINLKTIKKVYINLDERIDRRNKIEESFKKLNYVNYERFSAIRLPKQKKAFNIGCSQSHHNLMEKYKDNIPLFLLEDDAIPTLWYDEMVTDGILEVPDNADAIYAGISAGGDWEKIGVNFCAENYNDRWLKLKHCLGTHAIIFLNDNINKFIENSASSIQRKLPLDVAYALEIIPNLNIYAPKKPLFYQWDICWITSNINVIPEKNEWISFNPNGDINTIRKYSCERNI